MASENKTLPFTIQIESKNEPPQPYGMVGPSYKPLDDPDLKKVQKPDAGQQPTTKNTSTVISLPEIIENVGDQDTLVTGMIFTTKTIRQAFIKKVFCIVFMQLVITALVTFGLLQCHQYLRFAEKNVFLVLGGSICCYFTTFLAMLIFTSARRKVPYNYIFLMLFTLSLTMILPLILEQIPADQIMFAVGLTFAVVFALTLFAFQTKIDFTFLTSYCLCLMLPLILLGITVLTTNCEALNLLYTTIGVIIISIYIVSDVQMIIGGEHRYGFSPEEYVFAALVLYVDIMYLFLKLLRYSR